MNNIFLNEYAGVDMISTGNELLFYNVMGNSFLYAPDEDISQDEQDGELVLDLGALNSQPQPSPEDFVATTTTVADGAGAATVTAVAEGSNDVGNTNGAGNANDTDGIISAVTSPANNAEIADGAVNSANNIKTTRVADDFIGDEQLLDNTAEDGMYVGIDTEENGLLISPNPISGEAPAKGETETTETTQRVETIIPDAPYTAAVVLTGISVVFIILILLIFLMKALGVFFATDEEKAKKVELKKTSAAKPEVKKTAVAKPEVKKPAVAKTSAPAVQKAAVAPAVSEDEDEIVAVIAAAIASIYEGTNTEYRIAQIAPVRQRSAWSLAGLRHNTSPF